MGELYGTWIISQQSNRGPYPSPFYSRALKKKKTIILKSKPEFLSCSDCTPCLACPFSHSFLTVPKAGSRTRSPLESYTKPQWSHGNSGSGLPTPCLIWRWLFSKTKRESHLPDRHFRGEDHLARSAVTLPNTSNAQAQCRPSTLFRNSTSVFITELRLLLPRPHNFVLYTH